MKNNDFTLFIDLDGTVYDKHNGMWEEMSARIDEFMRTRIGIPEEDLLPTREKYYARYGSTLRGIQTHHAINPDEYLAFVHDLDLTNYLAPDPDLKEVLRSIPYPKWIFTNSDRDHAQRVMQILEIGDLFEGILDVRAMFFIPKPERWTYRNAMTLAQQHDPRKCIFVDDTLKNLGPPKSMGWKTVWVDSYTKHPAASYSIPKPHYLPEVIAQIDLEEKSDVIYQPELQFPELRAESVNWSGT